eukprot:m.71140 g.71140  ORF g.71140 m.71140 type:complete len:505 (-) comp10053_c0_seq1:234-1748(-)
MDENDTANDEAIARALQAAEEAEHAAIAESAARLHDPGVRLSASVPSTPPRSAPGTPPRPRRTSAAPGSPGRGRGELRESSEASRDHPQGEGADSVSSPLKGDTRSPRRVGRGANHRRTKSGDAAVGTGRMTSVGTAKRGEAAAAAGGGEGRQHRRSSSSSSQDSFSDTASSTYKRMRGRYDQWRENQRAIANSIRELSPRLQQLGLRAKVPLNDLTGAYRTFFTKWEQLVKAKTVTAEEMAAAVQAAYDGVDDKIWGGSAAWAAVDEAVATASQAFFEQYLMDQLYELVFAANPDDEHMDLKLQEKIRLLRWVSPEHLKANFDPDNPLVQKAFENAQDQLIMMDSQRAPHEKLERVVSASKGIFDVLQLAGGSPAGADDFMPLLIYTVIRANPPMLYSNLQYITRFSNQKKLNSGEAGYFYTNLYGAVEFVSTIDAEALQMSPREFHERMQQNDLYKPVPELKSHAALLQALEELAALGPRQDKLRADLAAVHDLLDASLAAA